MRISHKCPHCGQEVRTQSSNEQIIRDEQTRDLSVSVSCPACAQTFGIPLNLRPERPTSVATATATALWPEPPLPAPAPPSPPVRQPETGEPQFSRLTSPAPQGPVEPPAPSRGSVSFAPAATREQPAVRAPGFAPAAATASETKTAPAPPSDVTPRPSLNERFKRLPEWAQWLFVVFCIVVVGVIIFALPFGSPPPSTTREVEPRPTPPEPIHPGPLNLAPLPPNAWLEPSPEVAVFAPVADPDTATILQSKRLWAYDTHALGPRRSHVRKPWP